MHCITRKHQNIMFELHLCNQKYWCLPEKCRQRHWSCCKAHDCHVQISRFYLIPSWQPPPVASPSPLSIGPCMSENLMSITSHQCIQPGNLRGWNCLPCIHRVWPEMRCVHVHRQLEANQIPRYPQCLFIVVVHHPPRSRLLLEHHTPPRMPPILNEEHLTPCAQIVNKGIVWIHTIYAHPPMHHTLGHTSTGRSHIPT